MAYILYISIILLICSQVLFIGISFPTVVAFLCWSIPGIIFIIVGVYICKKNNKNEHIGGALGLAAWFIFTIIAVILLLPFSE